MKPPAAERRPLDMDKLAKVLALAHSENQGEAVSAVAAAARMLAQSGHALAEIVEAGIQRTGVNVAEETRRELAALRRKTDEQDRQLRDYKAAMKNLVHQVWDGHAEGEKAESAAAEAAAADAEPVLDTRYRPNLYA